MFPADLRRALGRHNQNQKARAMNAKKICSICAGVSKDTRCKAAPFGGLCCDDCYDRVVQPVRLLFADRVTPGLLSTLRSIAKEGRRILDQKAIETVMAAHAVSDEADS